jgi:hypothetical protein
MSPTTGLDTEVTVTRDLPLVTEPLAESLDWLNYPQLSHIRDNLKDKKKFHWFYFTNANSTSEPVPMVSHTRTLRPPTVPLPEECYQVSGTPPTVSSPCTHARMSVRTTGTRTRLPCHTKLYRHTRNLHNSPLTASLCVTQMKRTLLRTKTAAELLKQNWTISGLQCCVFRRHQNNSDVYIASNFRVRSYYSYSSLWEPQVRLDTIQV